MPSISHLFIYFIILGNRACLTHRNTEAIAICSITMWLSWVNSMACSFFFFRRTEHLYYEHEILLPWIFQSWKIRLWGAAIELNVFQQWLTYYIKFFQRIIHYSYEIGIHQSTRVQQPATGTPTNSIILVTLSNVTRFSLPSAPVLCCSSCRHRPSPANAHVTRDIALFRKYIAAIQSKG